MLQLRQERNDHNHKVQASQTCREQDTFKDGMVGLQSKIL